MNADIKAIEAATRTYLDGLYEGDADKLAHVFHETSALTTAREDGTIQIVPRGEWLEAVRNRPSPKSQNLSRHDEIVQIDIAGPTTAFVKVKCAIPPRFFVDYLTLIKTGEGWKIVAKAFKTDVRS